MKQIHYRPDIDGLRAVAILPVMLFHFGFPAFGGGYVGVDVFFVISGFLITSILYDEMRSGRFSFVSFYERRIRRIFPALFAVLAFTLVTAEALQLPNDLKSMSQSVVAATIFGSNLLFWKTAGYFDSWAETKPLLHTWSLSVEEQFYIFFPVLLLLMLKLARRHVTFVLAGFALLSLSASAYFLADHSSPVFYLLPFRAWELLLGALLAIGALPNPASQHLRDGMSAIGIGLIGYSIFAFSAQTAFPGANALYPCLGAAMLIYAGKGGHSAVGRLLSFKPIVLIGLISYSLYLWHWPLIVFAKYFAVRELTTAEKLAVLVVAFMLAALSWRYVERPFRGKSGQLSPKLLFGASAAIMAIFVAAGLLGHLYKGFPARMSPETVKLAFAADEYDPYRNQCQDLAPARIIRGEVCKLGNAENAAPTFLLWGDSHALALAPALDTLARQAAHAGLFVGRNACPPLLGVERYDLNHACRSYNDAVAQLVAQNKGIRTVILAGRWALHANGIRYGKEAGQPAVISPEGMSGNRVAFHQGLEHTLQFLKQKNIEVVFVSDVPEIGWNVPSTLGRTRLFGREVPAGPSEAAYHDRQQPVNDILRELSSRYHFRVINMASTFCPGDMCLVEQGGESLYRDAHHLSTAGARLAETALEGVFEHAE